MQLFSQLHNEQSNCGSTSQSPIRKIKVKITVKSANLNCLNSGGEWEEANELNTNTKKAVGMCITHCATVNADRWVFYKLKQGSDPIQSQTYYVKQVLFNGEGTVSVD